MKGSKAKVPVQYVRQVPKFLQAHAHLLNRGPPAGDGSDDEALDPRLALKRDDQEEDDSVDDTAAEVGDCATCRHEPFNDPVASLA